MKNLAYKPIQAFLTLILFLFITISVAKAGTIKDRVSSTTAAAAQFVPDQQLLINLMVLLPGNVEGLADGLRMRYNVGYLRTIEDDAVKMNNFSENISSYRQNTDLIVERRPIIETRDTVFLRLTNTTIRDYRLKMYTKTFGTTHLLAYIEDTWLKRYQVINLNGDTTDFNFSVTSNPASAASNRFRVIFMGFGTLPFHFTSIGAIRKQSGVEVKWTAADDIDVKQYDIQRSFNGVEFSTVGTVQPGNSGSNSNTYNWMDKFPVKGNNYYRIRSVNRGGEITYSTIVKTSIDNGAEGISVYPNPVTNHTLNFMLLQMDKGAYGLQLINGMGQVVMNQQLNHAGGTAKQSVSINAAIPEGRYTLVIQKPDNSRVQQALIVMK